MEMFGKEPVAQAIQMLIHNSNVGFSNINSDLNTLHHLVDELSCPASQKAAIYRTLGTIGNSRKYLMKIQDDFYIKAKNDFK